LGNLRDNGTTHLHITSPSGTQEQVLNRVKAPAGMEVIAVDRDCYLNSELADKQFDMLSQMFPTKTSYLKAETEANNIALDTLGFSKVTSTKDLSKDKS